MKRLILIDAHAVIHRAYHALPPLTSSSGEPAGAVYGFASILLRILRELKPDYIVAAFDLPGPTFRHVAYERYKAQRPETPSDLASQFQLTRELLRAFGIEVLTKEGFEADDIIGTLAEKYGGKKDLEIIIVTGDMDTLQLVRRGVKVYAMKKGISETVIYDEAGVRERYGFNPNQLIDFKGLKGDPSDNIPGVKGIGEKTAVDLIKKFSSIDGIYKALEKSKKEFSLSVAEKLSQGREEAFFSRELATINLTVPLEIDLENLLWYGTTNTEATRKFFETLGFFSLVRRLEGEGRPEPKQATLGISAVLHEKTPDDPKDINEIPKDFYGKEIGLILHGGDLYLIQKGEKGIYKISEKVFSKKETKKFFEKGSFRAFDGKEVIRHLRRLGIEIGEITFDILIATYLTSSLTRSFSYLAVVERELGRTVGEDAREEFTHFFEIERLLAEKIGAQKLETVFRNIELPVTRILADMEERGILLDSKFLGEFSKKLETEIKKITKDVHDLAGEEFNISSSKQLSVILFEKLGIQTHGLRKTAKGGVVSTRESELEKLKKDNPIIARILDYRELVKLKTTYVDSLPKLVDKKTGRLHTTFNQTGAVTGRLSSSDPNLQNIPIMTELGREVRKAFVAEKGYSLVSFDYSQIELRVAAHMADDKKMIQAFAQGVDIHALTASAIYGVSLDKVTPEARRAAKTLNFGVLYGMGPQAFSEATGMSREESKKFINEYFKNFSGVAEYIAATKHFAESNGYVETLFGRRRYLPEINSPNWQIKREAERMAVNMPIQGTATGDIVKMAMIGLDQWLKKEDLENEVRMLLQVHDELVFEIKELVLKKFVPEIKRIMESVAELKVPLVVDVKAGRNWGEQKPLAF